MKNVWLWRSLFALLGGAGGFAYYYFIGCVSGSCLITSNPWISTLYGGMMALLILPLLRHGTRKEQQE